MITRRNRQTKTMVTVYDEPGTGYFTICEDHQEAVQHPTLTAARSWAAEPRVWCQGCQS